MEWIFYILYIIAWSIFWSWAFFRKPNQPPPCIVYHKDNIGTIIVDGKVYVEKEWYDKACKAFFKATETGAGDCS